MASTSTSTLPRPSSRVDAATYSRPSSPVGQKYDKNATIVFIGQRGVGKSLVASLAGRALHRAVVEMQDGGGGGGAAEYTAALKDLQSGKILVIGDRYLHDPSLKHALEDYGRQHGPVIQVVREIDDTIDYLKKSGMGELQLQDIEACWSEREHELRNMATFIFPSVENSIGGHGGQDLHSWRPRTTNNNNNNNNNDDELPDEPTPTAASFVNEDLLRLLRFIRGTYTNHIPHTSARSYYLALTFENIQLALPLVDELSIGVDCWEVRADLLANPDINSIIHQIALLRRFSDLPIIFSLRTKSHAGSLPEPTEDDGVIDYMFEASLAAIKMGVEYVDVSDVLPRRMRSALIECKGNSRIIASCQDFSGRTSWQQDEVRLWSYYDESCSMGADIVMIVNLARDNEDNLAARRFVQRVQKQVPLIAFNVGMAGKISRIWNHFLTPVSHALLPKISAPGQLTYLESQQLLYITSATLPKTFYGFGVDLRDSLSSLIHTVAFQKLGLPYSYRVVESDHVELYSQIIADEHFGGATVNRPHKVDIIPFLRRLTPHAEAMGAVDTIIASPAGPVGENTDWRAIHTCILRCRLRSNSTDKEPSVLVVGAGGVARAAVYALLQLGIKKVQIVNRSLDRATALASFLGRLDPNFNIAIVGDLNTQLGDDWISPDIVISTIPQLESVQDLARLLPPEKVFAKSQGILLDMAYAPRLESPLNQLLRSMGNRNWDSVQETDTLLEQAYEQIRLWTGKRAPRTAIRNAVAKQREDLSSHSTT